MDQNEKRKIKKNLICSDATDKATACPNCKHFKRLPDSIFYCTLHSLRVRKADVCKSFSNKKMEVKKKPLPTLLEIRDAAKQTDNFKQSYLTALNNGEYRVG